MLAAGVTLLVLAATLLLTSGSDHPERGLVTRYLRYWEAGDYPHMYALFDRRSRARLSEPRFAAAYAAAAQTATLTSIRAGRLGSLSGGFLPVPVALHTRLFGTLREVLDMPIIGAGSSVAIAWHPEIVFPGLRAGERLSRQVTMPPRASILASDGTPLAQGLARTSPIPAVAGQIAGTLGPIPSADAAAYEALGYPSDAKVGLDGLERVFQQRLAGRPGGSLLGGRRTLAHTAPVPGQAVRTTIVPSIEQSAITAMGGRFSGIAAMNPRNGAILALAGVAFSALQPPGSTMKIITSTAALQAGIVHLGDTFPISTSSTLEGYTLQNANGEACGGTFLNAFAVSCNSVFAPLGAKLGAKRLVAMAERFGFNQPPTIPGESESTLPAANQIGGDLAVGSSAIGQGKVQASALEMTDVAATIADGGRRPIPTLLAGQPARFVRVTSHHVARLMQRMMIAVVQFGTGTPAAIPGVTVAGKTGTAELRNTTAPGTAGPQNTDSWFVGYAPVGHARIVAGALFPGAGAGAQTAAPAIRQVLIAGLAHH